MKNYVVESYEKYREEDRLTTNNARKIEFLNTVRILEEHIKSLTVLPEQGYMHFILQKITIV